MQQEPPPDVFTRVRSVDEIDWAAWQPVDRATLMFVIRAGQMLLIRKKRGLGAGKINGPGGRIEPGESAVDGAIRETQEEIGVTPIDPVQMGELEFQFVDGYSIHVWVFRSGDLQGDPIETDEAIPMWVPLERIPYDEMWEDDRIWLPRLLAGSRFHGRFVFDGDAMLNHELVERA